MRRTIALLRAINVGGHTVKMDHLRRLFEELGLVDVGTFIASGNVGFLADVDAAELEALIESHLRRSLGYEVATFIREPEELAAVAERRLFPDEALDTAGSSLYVAFLKAAPSDEATRVLLGYRSATDDFAVHGCEVYWYVPGNLSESPPFSAAFLEKTLGQPATMRSITTVRKLAAKYPPA